MYILMLFVFTGVSSLPTLAEAIETKEQSSEYEILEMEEDFMEEFKDLGDCVNVKVKIYNEDYQLVRCGSDKSRMITDLIKRADYLTEVGGIEIYRLNK